MSITFERGNVYIIFREHTFLFVIDIVSAFIFHDFYFQFCRRPCPILIILDLKMLPMIVLCGPK